MYIKRKYIKNKDGNSLFIKYQINNHGTLCVLLHGLSIDSDQNKKKDITALLSKNNIDWLSFDFSGMGESDGLFYNITPQAHIKDLLDVLSYIKTKYSHKKILIYGSSWGGYILLAALPELKKFKNIKVIVKNAPINFDKIIYAMIKVDQFKNWKKRGWARIYSNKLKSVTNQKISYKMWKGVKAINIIKRVKETDKTIYFIYGKKDKIVPPENHAERLKNLASSNIKLYKVNNMRHSQEEYEKRKDFEIAKKKLESILLKLITGK